MDARFTASHTRGMGTTYGAEEPHARSPQHANTTPCHQKYHSLDNSTQRRSIIVSDGSYSLCSVGLLCSCILPSLVSMGAQRLERGRRSLTRSFPASVVATGRVEPLLAADTIGVGANLEPSKRAARWFDSFFALYPSFTNDLHVRIATSLHQTQTKKRLRGFFSLRHHKQQQTHTRHEQQHHKTHHNTPHTTHTHTNSHPHTLEHTETMTRTTEHTTHTPAPIHRDTHGHRHGGCQEGAERACGEGVRRGLLLMTSNTHTHTSQFKLHSALNTTKQNIQNTYTHHHTSHFTHQSTTTTDTDRDIKSKNRTTRMTTERDIGSGRDRQTDRQKKDRKEPSAKHMTPTQKLKTSRVTTQNCVKHYSTDMVSSFDAFKCSASLTKKKNMVWIVSPGNFKCNSVINPWEDDKGQTNCYSSRQQDNSRTICGHPRNGMIRKSKI